MNHQKLVNVIFVKMISPFNLPPNQCDQIWQNFDTLAKISKTLAILTIYFVFCKILNLLCQLFLCYWAKFHCYKRPNIVPSGHTAPTLLTTSSRPLILPRMTWHRIRAFQRRRRRRTSSDDVVKNVCARKKFRKPFDLRNVFCNQCSQIGRFLIVLGN